MPAPIRTLYNKIPEKIRSSLNFLLKAILTVLAFYLLLSHQVQMVDHLPIALDNGSTVNLEAGETIRMGGNTLILVSGKKARKPDETKATASVSIHQGAHVYIPSDDGGEMLSGTTLPLESESTFEAIMGYLPKIEASTFWLFVLLAAGIKFIGILCSMFRWHLLLQGQGIRFPFRHIFGSFLIGRFLGTFLPSTIGLDGYKLYDASRFSRRTVEATAATVIEKVLGIVGIFITFLVALPFGMSILGDRAGQIAAITVPVASGIIIGFFTLLFYPGIVKWFIENLPIPGRRKIEGFIHRVSNAAAAYKTKKLLLLNAAFQSFMVHFCTAAMYFFTALAIGAVGATFWQVTFASSIQILATVLSPVTIAGEGIREMAQYFLLRNQMGPAEAIVSAALGFWAAEALTLFGAYFWWVRKKVYRPAFLYLDNQKADLDTLLASDDYGLEELRTEKEELGKGWMKTALFSRIIAGLSGGFLAGILLGLLEAIWILVMKGSSLDIFPYAMLMYGIIGALVGTGGGIFFGIIALAFGHVKGTVNSFALIFAGWFSLNLLILGRFRLFRDVWKEQALPKTVLLMLLLVCGITFVGLFVLSRTDKRAKDLYAIRPILLGGILIAAGTVVWGISAVISPGSDTKNQAYTTPQEIKDRPNVILIMCDALRADHLGCYGDTSAKTPVMDAMSDTGVRFHQAYAQASWTKPGTASIFTARYPSGHKTFLKPDILPDSLTTIAEVFQKAGYYTVGFPNNINISPGFNFGQGFHEYTYLAPDYFFGASESSSQVTYYSILRLVRERFLVKKKYPGHYYQEASVVNEHILEYIDRKGEQDRFFMYVHYMDPHDPYFKQPFNGVGYARVNMPHPDPNLAEELRSTYSGEISYMDGKLGELFEALKERNLWDNTIVVLTADHGEEFYEHDGWWHGTTLYEEQIRIPMIFKMPDNEMAGEIRMDRSRQIDLAPTLLGLCRIPAPDEMGLGRHLFRSPQSAETHLPVYAEEDHEGNMITCLIDDSWKYIKANPDNPRGLAEHELYRLDIDPFEKKNLSGKESEMRADMDRRMETAHEAAEKNAAERQVKELDADELQRMKNLGYIVEDE